jgi:hypothetical protein
MLSPADGRIHHVRREIITEVVWLACCETGLGAVKCGIESTLPLDWKEFIMCDALLNSCGHLTSQT